MNLLLKNLKNILLYKIIIISLFLTLGITYIRIRIDKFEKINNVVIGIITDIKEKDEYLQIELKTKYRILVTYKGENVFKLGDIVKIEGEVEEPVGNTFPNLFSYKKYLKSKKINFIIKADSVKFLSENKSIKYKIKNSLVNHIGKYKSCNYLKTFLLGDNNDIDTDIRNTYQSNGISHLFAVSGMHLSLFAGILLFILKRLNEKIKYLIIIIFFIFFAFLTNYSPSILRALILYILLVQLYFYLH